MKNCLFCRIIAGELPATFVHRDQAVSVFMDIQPVNAGHLLVVPNVHAAQLADLDPDTGTEMFRTAQRMAALLRRSGLPCEGINLFLADGKTAGQEVPHIHLHVIPRVRNDGFGLKFAESYHRKPPREQIEETAERIRTAEERGGAGPASS